MNNKFIVVLPLIEQLNFGFSIYKETTTIVCEAESVLDLYKKYPQAIIIQKVKGENR